MASDRIAATRAVQDAMICGLEEESWVGSFAVQQAIAIAEMDGSESDERPVQRI
jgi:hypothetical protein